MNRKDLEKIKQYVGAASPGPWEYEENEYSWDLYAATPTQLIKVGDYEIPIAMHPAKILKAPKKGGPYANYWPTMKDMRLIIGASRDMKKLIEALESAWDELAELNPEKYGGMNGT